MLQHGAGPYLRLNETLCVTACSFYARRMVELLQGGEKSGESQQAASSLNALLTGGARKKASVRLSVSEASP